MSQQAITVHLPEHLYRRVYKLARELNHSVLAGASRQDVTV